MRNINSYSFKKRDTINVKNDLLDRKNAKIVINQNLHNRVNLQKKKNNANNLSASVFCHPGYGRWNPFLRDGAAFGPCRS